MTTDVCRDCRVRDVFVELDFTKGHWPQACGTFSGSYTNRCTRCGWHRERHIPAMLDCVERRRVYLEHRGYYNVFNKDYR
jgi:hypothetical protein